MSSEYDKLIPRMSYVVDNYFDGNGSEFARTANISRQNYHGWVSYYEDNKEDPNIKWDKLQGVIDAVLNETDISIIWFLTGRGTPEISKKEPVLAQQFSDHKKEVNALNNSGLNQDQILGYLLQNRKAVLEFLRSLE